MRYTILLIALSFCCLNSHAEIGWLAAGASYSSFNNVGPDDASKLKHAGSFFFDIDAAPKFPLMAAHYGYRSTSVSDVDMSLNNQPSQEVDFKLTSHELGIKFILPMPTFDVYLGVGGLFGRATIDNEKSNAYGYYWQAGFHYFFNKYFGFKFAYQKNQVHTNDFKNLDGKELKFDQGLFSIGLVLRFGDSLTDALLK